MRDDDLGTPDAQAVALLHTRLAGRPAGPARHDAAELLDHALLTGLAVAAPLALTSAGAAAGATAVAALSALTLACVAGLAWSARRYHGVGLFDWPHSRAARRGTRPAVAILPLVGQHRSVRAGRKSATRRPR